MEFKVKHEELLKLTKDVDIGTEWNLKESGFGSWGSGGGVDIGTEWNLKERTESGVLCHFVVDIGTEWNLK